MCLRCRRFGLRLESRLRTRRSETWRDSKAKPDFPLDPSLLFLDAGREPGVESVVEGVGAVVAADRRVEQRRQMRHLVGQPVLAADLE